MKNSSYRNFSSGKNKKGKKADPRTSLFSLICTFAVIVLLAYFFPSKGKEINTSKNQGREIQVSMYQADLEAL